MSVHLGTKLQIRYCSLIVMVKKPSENKIGPFLEQKMFFGPKIGLKNHN